VWAEVEVDRKRKKIDLLVHQWSFEIDKRAPSLNILSDAFLIYSSHHVCESALTCVCVRVHLCMRVMCALEICGTTSKACNFSHTAQSKSSSSLLNLEQMQLFEFKIVKTLITLTYSILYVSKSCEHQVKYQYLC